MDLGVEGLGVLLRALLITGMSLDIEHLCNHQLTPVACRGTSKFPWEGNRRQIEFPAITPQLLPRLVFSSSYVLVASHPLDNTQYYIFAFKLNNIGY
jgi:hypothetical protein